MSRLLKSCATPPARRPIASIFSASPSRRSRRLRSLTSLASTSDASRPSKTIRPAVISTSISVPSLRRWRQVRGMGEPGALRMLASMSGMSSGGRMSAIVIVEELLARVAVAAHGGLVDGEERERLDVVDPHRQRVGLEEQPVALLGALERAVQADVVDRVGGAARELGGEPHVGALERALVASEGQRADRAVAAEQRHGQLVLGELALAGARDPRGHRGIDGQRIVAGPRDREPPQAALLGDHIDRA